MMELKEIRDFLKSSNIAENYYIGHLDSKKNKSIGVYPLNRGNDFERAVGDETNDVIHMKPVSVLLHWNQNAADTETAGIQLYNFIRAIAPGTLIGNHVVNYVGMLQNEPVDVYTDEFKVYERVIEFIVYYNE